MSVEDDEPTGADETFDDVTGDGPLLALEDLQVEFEDETALMEAIPQGIKERFGWESEPLRAVDGIDLEIGENDIVAIVGESGSGKTTLGKTAIGLQEPTGGSVKYQGHDIWELRERTQIDGLRFEEVRRKLQIVHQDPGAALNPYRKIMTSLKQPLHRWYPELSHADYRERIFGLFRECGLTPVEEYADRYPHELSGGEQQRIVLIRSMLVEPDLILADEPVSALDPSLGIALLDLMLELQDIFETSYLFITHNLEQARYITSQVDGKIAIMYLGEIVEYGPAEEVLRNPKHPYTKILKWATLPKHPDEAREKLQAKPPLRSFESPDVADPPDGCRFHTRCPKARELCAERSPELLDVEDAEERQAACYLETSGTHDYWQSQFLDENGEIEIPGE